MKDIFTIERSNERDVTEMHTDLISYDTKEAAEQQLLQEGYKKNQSDGGQVFYQQGDEYGIIRRQLLKEGTVTGIQFYDNFIDYLCDKFNADRDELERKFKKEIGHD